MRDVEDLILQSLRITIAEGTDIPSGSIWLKKPSVEFLQQQADGPNVGNPTPPQLPCVAINYLKDAQFNYNNYGESRYVNDDAELSTVYSPLAEIKLTLAISIFTKSKKELRELGTQMYMTLLKNKFLRYPTDIIQGEYASLELRSQQETGWAQPFQKVFVVEALGRILQETQAYRVKEIIVGIETSTIGYDVEEVIVNIDGNPTNPLSVDTTTEFDAGTFERTDAL